jgi:hypothetical protein
MRHRDGDLAVSLHASLNNVAVTRAWVLALIVALTACATHLPTGVVKYRYQAIAIAQRECAKSSKSYTGAWQAQLTGESWFVWKGKHAWMHVTIDARDGSTDGCVIVG